MSTTAAERPTKQQGTDWSEVHRTRYEKAPRPSRATQPHRPVVNTSEIVEFNRPVARAALQALVDGKRPEDVLTPAQRQLVSRDLRPALRAARAGLAKGKHGDLALLAAVSTVYNKAVELAGEHRTTRDRLVISMSYHHKVLGLWKTAGLGNRNGPVEIKRRKFGMPLPKDASDPRLAEYGPVEDLEAAVGELADAARAMAELAAWIEEAKDLRDKYVVQARALGATPNEVGAIIGRETPRVAQIVSRYGNEDMEVSA